MIKQLCGPNGSTILFCTKIGIIRFSYVLWTSILHKKGRHDFRKNCEDLKFGKHNEAAGMEFGDFFFGLFHFCDENPRRNM